MGVSKVQFGNQTLIDLTGDTVTAEALAEGYTAHGADGEPVRGTGILGGNYYSTDDAATSAIADADYIPFFDTSETLKTKILFSTIKSAIAGTVTKSSLGLGNVENKSSATIRGELTAANVTAALGYTPPQQDTNTWRPIGTGATDAAAGNHTHGTTIAADSGTNQLTMAANTKYKLTAGGTSFIFTTPPDANSKYSFSNADATLSWGTRTKIATTGGTDIYVTMPANPNTDHYAWSDITGKPSTTIASDSGSATLTMAANTTYKLTAAGSSFIFKTPPDANSQYSFSDKNVTLAWGTKSTIATVGGTDIHVTMPANPNTDHYAWSDITGKPSTFTPASHTHNYAGSSSAGGVATSAYILERNTGVSNTTGMQYTVGSITIGTADGNSKEGSNGSYKLWSYPAGGTAINNNTSANIQNIRFYWGSTYFRDIFISPNNSAIYHRAVSNGSPGSWYQVYDTGHKPSKSDIGLGSVANYDQSKAIKSITRSGTTFTYTCLDGTTGTFTQQDNNSTYSFTNADATLSWGTRTKIATTGGTDIYVTMPANPNTDHYAWSDITGKPSTTLATDTGTSSITLAYGGKYKLTAAGSAVIFTMPASDNTNTWRGIQDNLTSSTNTTESLSAKQGYLLANGSARDDTKALKTEAIKSISRSGTTFTATRCDGTTFTFTQQDNNTTYAFETTTTSNLGVDSTTLKSAIGYISGLTKANWNYQQTDGAVYRQTYNASWIHQIFGDYRTGQLSVRGKNNGTWQSWRRVLDETNYTSIISLGSCSGLTKSQVTTALGYTPPTSDTNTWRPVGTGATDAAAGNHTHTLSIATDSGTNQLTMAANTKYKLTAGGSSYIFTTPPDNNTNTTYTIATGDSNGQIKVTPSSGSAYNVSVKGLGTAAYTASTAYATAGHTHSNHITTYKYTATVTTSTSATVNATFTGAYANGAVYDIFFSDSRARYTSYSVSGSNIVVTIAKAPASFSLTCTLIRIGA